MAPNRSQIRLKTAMERLRYYKTRTPPMPRKPNYQFERLDRERIKAAKAAEKAAAKRELKEREKSGDAPDGGPPGKED